MAFATAIKDSRENIASLSHVHCKQKFSITFNYLLPLHFHDKGNEYKLSLFFHFLSCICLFLIVTTNDDPSPHPTDSDKVNYLECGGHGLCNAGECECYLDWSGRVCECSTLQTNCIAPDKLDKKRICSNHGDCICNQCECHGNARGKFCETSALADPSENSLCLYYENCVKCIVNRRLQKECSDYEKLCSSDEGVLHESEFYDNIRGEWNVDFWFKEPIIVSVAFISQLSSHQTRILPAYHVYATTRTPFVNTNLPII